MTAVPAAYQGYVSQAAEQLGIPQSVVAAQIQLESDWNPRAVSGAGAEGIAQFIPSTFAEYGPKGGSPFNVADAFAAYTAYMRALLRQEGGDVRKALEAYNAGPGNIGAGAAYASTIIQRSGQTVGKAASKSDQQPSSGGLLDWPGEITGWFTARAEESAKLFGVAEKIFAPETYVRAGSGAIGAVFLIMGIIGLIASARKKA